MLRAIAFGAACGAGIQAWRAWPADGPVSAAPAAVLFAVAVVCAYLGGRWRSRGRVSATAVAHAVASSSADAVASNTVNVAVVLPGAGTAGAGSGLYELEQAPWFGGQRAAITSDDLDGMSLEDVMDTSEAETEYA